MNDLLKTLGENLSPEAQAELEAQAAPEPEVELPPEEGILAKMIQTLDGLNTSLYSMHQQLRTMENRLNLAEKYIGYLLTRDPDFAKNMEESLARQESTAKDG